MSVNLIQELPRQLLSCLILVTLLCVPTAGARADGLKFAGQSTLSHNDMLGDRHDRWRTGGYTHSFFFSGADRSYELRGRVEWITPFRGDDPSLPDRPSTGVVGVGAFVHQRRGEYSIKYGAEAVMTDSEILKIQDSFHEMAGFDGGYMHDGSDDPMLDRRAYLSGTIEVAREFQLGRIGTIRPFIEAEAGFENFVRIGGDIAVSSSGFASLVSRDPVTGFLVPTKANLRKTHPRRSLVSGYIGADLTLIDGSSLYRGTDTASRHLRNRIRAGVIIGGRRHQFFYGITRLSKEFSGQSEAQYLGSTSFSLRF